MSGVHGGGGVDGSRNHDDNNGDVAKHFNLLIYLRIIIIIWMYVRCSVFRSSSILHTHYIRYCEMTNIDFTFVGPTLHTHFFHSSSYLYARVYIYIYACVLKTCWPPNGERTKRYTQCHSLENLIKLMKHLFSNNDINIFLIYKITLARWMVCCVWEMACALIHVHALFLSMLFHCLFFCTRGPCDG